MVDVTNVTSDELSVIGRVQSKNKVVRKYLNLTLYKIITDENGIQEPPVPVTELSNGASITITIPLQDLAGTSGIEVVRVHNGSSGLEGYRYEVDMDSSPSTFTLTSNKFSTYAILAPKAQDPTTEQPTTQPATSTRQPISEITVNRPTTEQPSTSQPTTSSASNGTNGTSGTTSFRSVSSGSGGAKTGDAAPVAGMIILMIASAGGVIGLKKKIKKES